LLRMEPHTMARSDKDDQETPGYRSPWRVLARFFEKSRDLWKAKYQALQERIKEFRTEVRDLRRSRDRWRAKAEALEQQIGEMRGQMQRPAEQSPPAPRQRSHGVLTQLSS
jgi:septal ring factor EnvC (AmiA/AmiB activator)